MENRRKEQQLDLCHRTSTQTFESNQLQTLVVCNGLCPDAGFSATLFTRTSLAKATVGTIRLTLLKLDKITVSVRRVLIAIASACPYQDILAIAYQRLQAISDSG
jgi:hypothetical protein